MMDANASYHLAWSRAFWSELVNQTKSVVRYDAQSVVAGWRIRLAWDSEQRGRVYVCPEHVSRACSDACERRYFIFASFDPRTEARRLLAELRALPPVNSGRRRVATDRRQIFAARN